MLIAWQSHGMNEICHVKIVSLKSEKSRSVGSRAIGKTVLVVFSFMNMQEFVFRKQDLRSST